MLIKILLYILLESLLTFVTFLGWPPAPQSRKSVLAHLFFTPSGRPPAPHSHMVAAAKMHAAGLLHRATPLCQVWPN